MIPQENYKVLLVGAYRGHVYGDCFDDTGDNISEKNANYCELTGVYWLWKNLQKDDYVASCITDVCFPDLSARAKTFRQRYPETAWKI